MRDESNRSGDRIPARHYVPPRAPPRPSEPPPAETAAIRLDPAIDPRLARTIPRLSAPGSDAAWRAERPRSPERRLGLVWAASAFFLLLALILVGLPLLSSRDEPKVAEPHAAATTSPVPPAAEPASAAALPEVSEATPGSPTRMEERPSVGVSRAAAVPQPEVASTRTKAASKQPAREVWLK